MTVRWFLTGLLLFTISFGIISWLAINTSREVVLLSLIPLGIASFIWGFNIKRSL